MSAPTLPSRDDQITLERIRGITLSTKLVAWDHPDLDDIIQEVAIRIWKRPDMAPTVLARSAILDYLRAHGTHTRTGKAKITGNTLSLDAPARLRRGEGAIPIVDTFASTDQPVDEIDFGDPLLKSRILDVLSPKERYIALAIANGTPQNMLADEFRVSESRLSQWVDVIRARLTGEMPPNQRGGRKAIPKPSTVRRPWDTPDKRRKEIQVLQGLADGKLVSEIATDMGRHERTVENYLRSAQHRLGVQPARGSGGRARHAAAVAEAMRRGLIK